MKLFNILHLPVVPQGKRTSSARTSHLSDVHDEEKEEFSYQTTRCLSSYYSIFVARLAIMVMLAIIIGMLTISTWHFTRVYTTKSINSLAYGLRYELLQRPILRMWNILNSTVEVTVAQVKLSEYVISQYDNPVTQTQQPELHQVMRSITWALFASRKALNAITISYRNGFVQAFHRDHRSNMTYYIYSELVNSSVNEAGKAQNAQTLISKDSNISAKWYREPLDPVTGEKEGECRQIPPDDLINIAGLSEVSDGTASWRVSVSKFTGSPVLSAALPVRHPSNGIIVAAVGVSTALKSVGQLMRELVDFHSGYMYLTSREGYLLATSTNTPLLRNTTTGLKLLMANDSENHMIRSGAQWLCTAYGDQFPISHEVHAENVKIGNQRYYIDSFFLNLKRLPLVGVIIIPRKYIMGKADQIGFTTLIISISASICTLGIGCVCILILTSGVSKAMKLKAELISQLDARRRAEASSNYKSQFLANMSHELRTPMAAVIGLLDILAYDDCLTNEQLATVTQIRKCSTALLRLLNNILDLSKVESGKLVLEEEEFDLGRELEGIVDMFSVQCINHDMEIVLDLSDDMPKVVRGDSARVVQIFTNLISNSIKFTLEGHVILRGWCGSSGHSTKSEWPNYQKKTKFAPKTKSKQQDCRMKEDSEINDKVALWFEVEDSGCGIDPRKRESVFESFEQADPSTTRTHGGTGLGLCIVRNFVNKMGGEIKVVKKDGPGTLMQLYLVLGKAESSKEKTFQPDFSKHNLKVLLALHENMGRHIMSKWLRENGACTWEASQWNGLTQLFQQIFEGGLQCIGSESVRLSTMAVVSNGIKVQNMIVIVVDTSLLDQSTDIWKEQLIFLDKYRGKAKFVWVLSQNTSNAIKVELRQKGHILMLNKPIYKTKMMHVLENIIRESDSEFQRYGTEENSDMLVNLHELHEIDPIPFDMTSSYDSDISNTEHLDSGINPFPNREKIEEMVLESYCSGDETRRHTSRRESYQTTLPDEIVHGPNLILKSVKYSDISRGFIKANSHGDKSILPSRRYEHEKENKISTISSMAEKVSNPRPQPATDCFERDSSLFINITQLHTQEVMMIEQEREYPATSTSNKTRFMKQNLTNPKSESTLDTLQVKQVEKQLNPQEHAAPDSRSLELNKDQNVDNSYNNEDRLASSKIIPQQCPLESLNILLAEDNPILQRVGTVMLEKVGARVVTVKDGMQAVDAMRLMFFEVDSGRQTSTQQDGQHKALEHLQNNPTVDLILMDCQMPKLDGYEATKAIRKMQAGTGLHIPIVAVTAHAMSSDEAKCLEVGMDAYLTKPIDRNLMVSTILSLTKRNANHPKYQKRNSETQTCQKR